MESDRSTRQEEDESMNRVFFVLLILAMFFTLPTWPYSKDWGYYPSGGLGLILLIEFLLALTGRI